MINIKEEKLTQIFQNIFNKKIVIIGDLMLDCYIWGNVNRISPEAPVPIVEVKEENYRFGGAANVGLNISSLGAVPYLVGVVGLDRESEIFRSLLKENNFIEDGIVFSNDRPTTVKTRILAHSQHLVRIDKEIRNEINKTVEEKILKYLNKNKKLIDAVIFQDYNKGVLTKNLIKEVIEFCNKQNIIVTVDPKYNNFFDYKNVTVFKPNKKESEDALGYKLETDEQVFIAGKEIKNRLNAKNVIITRSEKGMTLFSEDEEIFTIPTKARKVADVSGAGDTVIATLTLTLAAGANIKEAATIANLAGGLVCEEAGIVPIDRDSLIKNLLNK